MSQQNTKDKIGTKYPLVRPRRLSIQDRLDIGSRLYFGNLFTSYQIAGAGGRTLRDVVTSVFRNPILAEYFLTATSGSVKFVFRSDLTQAEGQALTGIRSKLFWIR